MKIISKQKQSVTLHTDSLDDLWSLSKIIEPNDLICGNTQRKIKIGDGETQRNTKVVKKWMKLSVIAEKIEYEPEHKLLRVLGPIEEGNDDVAKGEYHSFSIEEGSEITITKNWSVEQRKRLEQSVTNAISQVMVCVCDRDSALYGWLSASGFTQVSKLQGNVEKKYEGARGEENFFQKLVGAIKEHKPKSCIIGCSHFWQEQLLNECSQIGLKATFAEVNSVSTAGIGELLKKSSLKDNIVAAQSQLFEQILHKIGEGSTYGLEQLRKAAELAAISDLLITNEAIIKAKEKGKYENIEQLLELTENTGGIVHIVEQESPVASQLDGLGGMAALLRFAVD